HEAERVGRLGLMQNLGGDVAAPQTLAEAQQATQTDILAAQLGQKRRGQRHRIALRHDRVVAVARRGQELGLTLEKEERRQHTLAQALRERIEPLIWETERR